MSDAISRTVDPSFKEQKVLFTTTRITCQFIIRPCFIAVGCLILVALLIVYSESSSQTTVLIADSKGTATEFSLDNKIANTNKNPH